jgi:deoxyribodipyrimidine photo-lyase
MPDTAVVWFRRDLRVATCPRSRTPAASTSASCRSSSSIPAAGGRFRSPGRTAWLLECLAALDGELRAAAGAWCVRHGRPETEVRRVARRGRRRDRARLRRRDRLRAARATPAWRRRSDATGRLRRHPGLYVADLPRSRTAPGRPYKVFTPFLRAWRAQARRVRSARRARSRRRRSRRASCRRCARWASTGAAAPAGRPRARRGRGPARGGQLAGSAGLERYAERRNVLAEPTSRLSAYLRFGCLSPLKLERAVAARRLRATATSSRGATSSPPSSCTSRRRARVELDARYRTLEWDRDPTLLAAWREGAPASPSSTPRCASSRDRLDAQPRAHDRRLRS